MAKKDTSHQTNGALVKSADPLGSGWANSTLKTIVSIFIVAVVFGVFLDAIIVSNTTLTTLQPYGQSTTFNLPANAYTNNAFNDTAANTIYITITGTPNSILSTAYPLTITIGGNSISAYGTNTVRPVAGVFETQTFTASNIVANAILSANTGNFYNLTSLTITPPAGIPLSNFSSGLSVLITQSFKAVKFGSAPQTFATNSITLTGAYSTTAQTISGYTPSSLYISLVSYVVTLANFVGIIILLVIIMIVILVIYALFAPTGVTTVANSGI